jgi:oligopeptidase A
LKPNPLLDWAERPEFAAIDAAHVLPAIDEALTRAHRARDALLNDPAAPTVANTIVPLESLRDALAEAFAPVGHLHGVRDSAPLREAYGVAIDRLTEWDSELKQDARLYARLKALRASSADRLGPVERKLLDDEIEDFELAGVGLPDAERAEFAEIQRRLSELATEVEQRVLDATEAFSYRVTDPAELDGLPEDVIAAAAARANGDGHVLDLKGPTYAAVMGYAKSRSLRAHFYRAWATRASEFGDHDTTDRILEILKLRQREAELLGFNDFVELSLKTKMAPDAATVERFLNDLATRARGPAEQELASLKRFARESLELEALEPWDLGFAQECLKRKRYAIDDELLKPYFPAERVVAGLFELAEALYGIRFVARNGVSLWHADARFFDLIDARGDNVGGVYLDLYARDGKRGGAWMDVCRTRSKLNALKRPIAFLNCNAPAPVDGRPSLFTHDDVVTLFHEFGHGIHHLLSEVDYPSASGVNGVEWDAVELPSQFFENFCYAPLVLKRLSAHVETGEPLPDALIERLLAARQYMAGLFLLRQVEFGLSDLALHAAKPAPSTREALLAVVDRVRREVALVQPPEWHRGILSFTHIFAGGYAAGYYSYLWAETLSADAFAALEEQGVLAPEPSAKFRREVLAQGGSRSATENFRAFRGRDPEPAALLKSYGLAA